MTEKQEQFEKKCAIAKTLGLDLGSPNQTETLPNGNTIYVRDAMGLHVDPILYAKKSCHDCNGNGVLTQTRPISIQQVEAMLKDDSRSAALIHYKANGKPELREKARCPCAMRGYAVKSTRLANAFAKAGIK